MGRWNQDSVSLFQWFYNRSTQLLFYKEEPHKISVWEYNEGRRNTQYSYGIYHRSSHNICKLEKNMDIAQVLWLNDGRVQLMEVGTCNKEYTVTQDNEELVEKYWPIKFLNMSGDEGQHFAREIFTREAKIVCDGSYFEGVASSAFITVSNYNVNGGNVLPGCKICQSAYRGELGGILGAIVFTKLICKKWNITEGSVVIGCDCQGALAAVRKKTRINSQWNSYDLVSCIIHEMQSTNITFTFRYIRGHQDNHKAADELDEWEQANVQADFLAKQMLQLHGKSEKTYIPTLKQGDMWTICFGQDLIVCDIRKNLYKYIWEDKIKRYWITKLHVHSSFRDHVNWEVIESISKGTADYKRQRYLKVMANIAPVGTTLYRRGEVASAHCPLCQEEESSSHIWACKHEGIEYITQRGFNEVLAMLVSGPPEFNTFFSSQLMHMRRQDITLVQNIDMSDIWQQALDQQKQMGISACMWGFYLTNVTGLGDEHFKGTRNKASRWLARITLKLWSIYDEMWSHRNEVKFEKGT